MKNLSGNGQLPLRTVAFICLSFAVFVSPAWSLPVAGSETPRRAGASLLPVFLRAGQYFKEHGACIENDRFCVVTYSRVPAFEGEPGMYVIKIAFDPEAQIINLYAKWSEFDRCRPYKTWEDFREKLPASLPAWWKEHRKTLSSAAYIADLQLTVREILHVLRLEPSQERDIMESFLSSHGNPNESLPSENEETACFADLDENTGLMWKIMIAPDFIACYTDGVAYGLLSSDMASRDLFQYR